MPFKPIAPTVVGDADGKSHVITPDDVFPDDHPFVKAAPGAFVRVGDEVARPVEQATAAPGEVRRGPGRPRKDAAGQ
jgi:hypothetical protein